MGFEGLGFRVWDLEVELLPGLDRQALIFVWVRQILHRLVDIRRGNRAKLGAENFLPTPGGAELGP